MSRRSDERRRAQCAKKVPYPTVRSARRAARWFRKHVTGKYRPGDGLLGHYRCEFGNHWHIGHSKYG